jgi:type I restriction enzyme M protein
VISLVDELQFRTHQEQLEMSHLYEWKIKNMWNAGRNWWEYYTPRPLIKTIIQVVAPTIWNTIYDWLKWHKNFRNIVQIKAWIS